MNDNGMLNNIILKRYPSLRVEWLQKFTSKVFSGVEFKGYLCNDRKSGDLFGTLFVYQVGGAPDIQFLPGMPEIPYTEQVPLLVPDQVRRVTIARKLDGTALIVNPLRLPDGSIEPLYRTRGTPVLKNNEFRSWRNLLDVAGQGGVRERIGAAVIRQNISLVFELWGPANFHSVTYNIDQPVRLSLHTAIRQQSILPWSQLMTIAKTAGLDLVDILWQSWVPGCDRDTVAHALLSEAVAIVETMEKWNDAERGHFSDEGVILSVDTAETCQRWKIKPETMQEYYRLSRAKLSPLMIRHACHKLLEWDQAPAVENLLSVLEQEGYSQEVILYNLEMVEREHQLWMELV